LSEEIAALTNQVDNLRNNPEKVKELQAKLEEAKRLQAELEADLAKSKAELDSLRRRQQEAEREGRGWNFNAKVCNARSKHYWLN
jgi:chromosome segregation ATPase